MMKLRQFVFIKQHQTPSYVAMYQNSISKNTFVNFSIWNDTKFNQQSFPEVLFDF